MQREALTTTCGRKTNEKYPAILSNPFKVIQLKV